MIFNPVPERRGDGLQHRIHGFDSHPDFQFDRM